MTPEQQDINLEGEQTGIEQKDKGPRIPETEAELQGKQAEYSRDIQNRVHNNEAATRNLELIHGADPDDQTKAIQDMNGTIFDAREIGKDFETDSADIVQPEESEATRKARQLVKNLNVPKEPELADDPSDDHLPPVEEITAHLAPEAKAAGLELLQEVFDKIQTESKDRQSLEQTAALLKRFAPILEKFNKTIIERNILPPDLAKEKTKQITEALCLSVANGHLEASDIAAMVGTIEIIKDRQAEGQSSSYEGIAFYDFESRSIQISEGMLKDPTIRIDHMINHEVCHPTVRFGEIHKPSERAELDRYKENGAEITGERNQKLIGLIDRAQETKDYQPQHVRNVLQSINDAPSRFQQLSPERKQRYPDLESYVRACKVQAADEIITDYAAVFMRSNGDRDDFYAKCIDVADSSAFAQFLEKSGSTQEIMDNLAKDMKTENRENLLQNNPKLGEILKTYDFFYDFVSSAKDNFKGKISERISDGEEEIDPMAYDTGASFSGATPQDGGKSQTLISSFGGVAKAFAEDLDPTKVMTGGGKMAA